MDSSSCQIGAIEVSVPLPARVHGHAALSAHAHLPAALPARARAHAHVRARVHAALPRYFALRGPNGKYLGYVRDHPCRGFLSFCYDDLASPCVKQEVVEAEKGETHIKCCYNDKFWRKNGPREEWIVAAADSPNADRSSWLSTLFRANISQSHSGKISLSSVQGNGNGNHLAVCDSKAYNDCLFPSGEAARQGGRPVTYHAVSLVKFPPYVAFKGDNDKYLGTMVKIEDDDSIFFNSNDMADKRITHQVEEVRDSEGHIWIKNLYWKRYWSVCDDCRCIFVGWDDIATEDMYQQFLPVQLDEATVALRCRQGDQEFCMRFYYNNLPYLRAFSWSPEGSAVLKVEDCAKTRRVSSIVYDMSTADIYDLEPLVLATSTAVNNTKHPATYAMDFSYTDKKSQSWSNSVSFTTGVGFEFKAGVPLVESATVTLSAQISGSTEWGKTSEQETTVGTTYTVTVDPGEKVTINLEATQARCTVQFSYTQEDRLKSGETFTFSRTDGVFKGLNYTDIKYVANNS